MKEVLVKTPLAVVTALASYFAGILHELVFILILFMAADMVTGLMRGFLTKSLNSSIGLKGIFVKVSILMVIGVSAGIEYVLSLTGMDTNTVLTIGVTSFFIANEGLSILENSAQMGAPIPQPLLDALDKLNQAAGKEQQVKKRKKVN